jgi:competence protein ComEA
MHHVPAWARNKTRLIAAILLIIGALVIVSLWIGHSAAPAVDEAVDQRFAEATPEADAPEPASPTEAPAPDSAVIVYISGAVRAPDVYRLPSEARLKDLVIAAGGLSAEADPEQINLAERLKDGQHIRIPRQGEAPPASTGAEDTASATPEQGKLVNINTAGAAELDGLPGIGQSIADRIVEYRTTNGPFKAAEDLRNVKGIGPALFAKIAPLITVGP